MLKRVVSRLSYANVVATFALFFALGGTSYALIVNGALVQDESLTDADIRDGSIAAAIAGDAITGDEVADDSLTGDDVDEATLRVPQAGNANTLDGKDSTQFARISGSEKEHVTLPPAMAVDVTGAVKHREREPVSATATILLHNKGVVVPVSVKCSLNDRGSHAPFEMDSRTLELRPDVTERVSLTGARARGFSQISAECHASRSGVEALSGSLAVVAGA